MSANGLGCSRPALGDNRMGGSVAHGQRADLEQIMVRDRKPRFERDTPVMERPGSLLGGLASRRA